ncbi:MAG: TonB-dependent receptor [Candidatus Kapabacteria bacterium]|nr:TonB-dependent receptor [Ignavibacteriota bacterium]MCW5884248.1 TonB-dependent receptor [Candidatus Kapabacteria bacterium]
MKTKYQTIIVWAVLLCFTGIVELKAKGSMLLADHAAINGYIKDEQNGEILIGATVFIKNTKFGAYTNKQGFYNINNVPAGKYSVRISMVGYEPKEMSINLSKNEVKRMDISIKPASVRSEGISVTAEREVESRQISISKVNIPIQQIKEIRIGGESDVFRAIQMLPGVLTSSQISSGLYIRGGSPDQNLVLLDGTTVYNPSHLFGFISTFNSDAIKDVELIKGGYPAEYGSRLSSVLNITQKDGNRNEFEGLASVGLISSKLSLEGPIGNGSWFLGGRRTYFDLIKGAIDNDPKNPIPDFGFYDVNAKITQDFGSSDKISISGFMSDDDFKFSNSGFDMNMFLGNRSIGLKWTHIYGKDLFTNVNISGSHYSNGFKQDLSGFLITVNNAITDYTFRGTTEYFLSDVTTISSGIEFTNYIFEYNQNFTGDGQSGEQGTNEGGRTNLLYHDWVYSAFAQMNQQFTELLSLQAGIRANYWDYSRQMNFDPRIALRWQAQDNLAIKASWGIFHQYLRLAGDENFSLFDTWLPTDRTVDPSRAVHYILSFETEPLSGYNFNFDVYYKDLFNISELNRTNLEGKDVKDIFFTGNGSAYGAEIFLQKRFGKLAGWIGYGLGWVNANFDSINSGRTFRPKYDRRHDLKIVAQYQLNEKWTFGGTFMFQSGQSYTGAVSRLQVGMPGDNYGYGKIIPSERFGLRLPPSHQLNLNVGYNSTIFGLPTRYNLDIFNVYSRRDILMRVYNADDENTLVEDIRLLPIIPTFSFEIKF